jgi:cell division protein FtsB
MEYGIILQALGVVWSVIALVVGAIVVGSRRGLRESGARLSTEQTATIAIMSERIDALVAENTRLKTELAAVKAEVVKLRDELVLDERIMARIDQRLERGRDHDAR